MVPDHVSIVKLCALVPIFYEAFDEFFLRFGISNFGIIKIGVYIQWQWRARMYSLLRG